MGCFFFFSKPSIHQFLCDISAQSCTLLILNDWLCFLGWHCPCHVNSLLSGNHWILFWTWLPSQDLLFPFCSSHWGTVHFLERTLSIPVLLSPLVSGSIFFEEELYSCCLPGGFNDKQHGKSSTVFFLFYKFMTEFFCWWPTLPLSRVCKSPKSNFFKNCQQLLMSVKLWKHHSPPNVRQSPVVKSRVITRFPWTFPFNMIWL